jgi:hypothetical protein
MAKVQLRLSQVVGAYGSGAMVDLPNDSIIISGLDFWEYDNSNLPIIEEPRLVAVLRQILDVPTLTLRTPPPSSEQNFGRQPNITGFRFPEWFFVQRDEKGRGNWRRRRLVHVDSLQNGKFRNRDGKQDSVVPIRFVRACPKGHVGDIDWKAFAHGTQSDCPRDIWVEERGTSGDMNDIWILCDCGATRPMSAAATRQARALGKCNGSRPWLGPGTREPCGEFNRLLIRSASNAYFAQELSVISIPEAQSGIDAVVRAAWEDGLSVVESMEQLSLFKRIPNIAAKLSGYDDIDIFNAIVRVRNGDSNTGRSIKEVEYIALAEAREELGSDTPGGDFYARALPKDRWAAPWMDSIDRVVLVHRLREVVAQVGFTRFEAAAPDINGDLDLGVQRAPLALNASWLPAVENRGEGVFMVFNPAAIAAWLERDAVKMRGKDLVEGFKAWKADHPQSSREFPGLPYYMLHSFSHLLLTAIALECGYPVSSLRERIYVGPDQDQYGVLIYTGSSDAEGTAGRVGGGGAFDTAARSPCARTRRALFQRPGLRVSFTPGAGSPAAPGQRLSWVPAGRRNLVRAAERLP